MVRFGSTVVAALMAVASVTPACATTYMTFNGSSGTFGNNLVTPNASGTFSDSFKLGKFAAGDYLFTGTITSSYQGDPNDTKNPQNIDFTSVTLNNQNFNIVSTGQFEFRTIANVPSTMMNILAVAGTAGSSATYSGTFNVAAVPEASTWGLMLVGFGIVGYALRSGRRDRLAANQL